MKIAVLTSGGVDSAVALCELKRQGHDVTAFYLKIWLEDELAFLGECPWEEDLAFARAVCDQEGVELRVVSLQQAYWSRVVSYTLAEVQAGRTPNPDILCNQQIKFGAFLDQLEEPFERVATGHYARLQEIEGRAHLFRSPDPVKDQTYFLSQLTPAQLGRAHFPLGNYKKTEVRALAQQYNLPNQARKDSQGLCFLGKISFKAFLKAHLGVREGNLVEQETGKELGRHDGYWNYTMGQRQGLGLSGGPWFVVGKNVSNNEVFLSKNPEALTALDQEGFRVESPHWLAGYIPPPGEVSLDVKLRHSPEFWPARVRFDAEGATLRLGKPASGIAPGQFTVFYQGEECLGSAVNASPTPPTTHH